MNRSTLTAPLLALALLSFSLGSAAAQAPSLDAGISIDAASTQSDASYDAAVPPRVVALVMPAQSALEELGSRELIIRVDAHGSAYVDACEYSALTCAQLQAALDASRFEPAQIAGQPRAARVRLGFAMPIAMDAGVAPLVHDAGPPPRPPASAPALEYGATARIEAAAPGTQHVTLEQLREVPGTFGDPFRILDALPGVVPVISGLPYAYVRGAPPAATAYFYDDLQMPALFHLGLGPGIIHPAMIEAVDFYPGVAPARYGRKTGGVLSGAGARQRDALHAELELRPIDLQGYVSVPFANGASVELAGRYGYPGLALKLFDPTAVLQYWDYQLRSFMPAGRGRTLSVVALGSFDLVGERKNGKLSRDLSLQFHRVEARATSRRRGITLGGALGAGYEQSGLADDMDISVLRVGPRLWLETDAGPSHLRIGADMLASIGHIEDRTGRSDSSSGGETEGLLASLQDPRLANVRGRYVIGLYAETQTQLTPRWRLNAGLRGDAWLTGSYVALGVEPRLSLEYATTERLRLHASVGLANQPVSFPIPLPGIADAVLQRGLQHSLQSELGARLELPHSFSAELTGYLNGYRGMLTFDSLTRDSICNEMGCTRSTPRVDALAYGMEVMLRRSYKERFSGWLAYTLGKASAFDRDGNALRTDFDVRHVLNAVFQWRLPKRWSFSMRAYARSGRYPFDASLTDDPRMRQRLPGFVRGDLQVSRTWPKRWGELRLTFDWLNFTLQREALSWDCDENRCQASKGGFPVTVPMIGLRGSH